MSALYANGRALVIGNTKEKIPYNHGDTNIQLAESSTPTLFVEHVVEGLSLSEGIHPIVLLLVKDVEHAILHPSHGINYGKIASGSNCYLPGQPIRTSWCASNSDPSRPGGDNLYWEKIPGPDGGFYYRSYNAMKGGPGGRSSVSLYMAPSADNTRVELSDIPYQWFSSLHAILSATLAENERLRQRNAIIEAALLQLRDVLYGIPPVSLTS